MRTTLASLITALPAALPVLAQVDSSGHLHLLVPLYVGVAFSSLFPRDHNLFPLSGAIALADDLNAQGSTLDRNLKKRCLL
jgi:hypothetical protein